MDRRNFLHPGHLIHAAGNLLGAAAALDGAAEQAEPGTVPLLRLARRAMATTFEILLPFGTADAQAIAESAFAEIDRLEQQLTVYHDSSEISRLNLLAHQVAVPVEENLFDLL